MFGTLVAETHSRVSRLWLALRSAAETDDAARELFTRCETERRLAMLHGPVPVMIEKGVLRDGLDAERAADLLWTFNDPALYRGRPLSVRGLDEILAGAKRRAGLEHATCHELRHTCLTRLREAGMALEAVQAQAGHASIESTRIYLHLADDWLSSQYRKAAEVLSAVSTQPRIGYLFLHGAGARRR